MSSSYKYAGFIFMVFPVILYLIPFLSRENVVFPLVALLPMISVIIINFRLSPEIKTYGLLHLYILSNVIFSVKNSSIQGVALMLFLIIYLHSTTSFPNMNFTKFNALSKRFAIGLSLLFIGLIFLPLLSKYSFTFGSWYLIASKEIPFLQTTMDGPFLIIILSSIIFATFKFRYKSLPAVIMMLAILAVAFYTLMVFNRRTIILMFFLLIPFYMFNKYKGNQIPVILLIATFLVPINFLIIIKYAASLANTPIFENIMGRSSDLNEDNGRLAGWILALKAYTNDFSLEDIFGYHKVLVRNADERYNHFHNGFIQLYYEQGLFGFVTTVALLIQLIKRVKVFKFLSLKGYKYVFVFPLIFTVLLFLQNTESIFRKITITNLFFIICSFFIIKISNLIKRTVIVAQTTIIEDEPTREVALENK